MSDVERWGFEDADDWEPTPKRPLTPEPSVAEPDGITGQDADRVVTVSVGPMGEVLSVRLAADWRRSVDPRALQGSVLTAANNAVMQALAKQVEQTEQTDVQPWPTPTAQPETTPLTTDAAFRLLDEVDAELATLTGRLDAVLNQPIEAESAGGHVRGGAMNGQVSTLTVDPYWAGSARNPEIEGELTEVLRELHRRGTSDPDLTRWPTSPAITELTALVSDPNLLLRRLGLS
ncbi:YbaB/EbfC family nucleoid-associated protein [Crossiella sp. SN42]|uniref:YbaB/EbfC family nucleoid-associated protein n=1 Tax=Crossiella sp. SN42 TaxID=2944808 RepID=UPI00207C27B9|nr:YbaB/EbfC family nucleoid-associated protein [Crossiella sp. SN42]MCO1581352.1 YbaB/EbfC family nucleoid-associated protein [Crossiella sp. SN42]